ncbi:MAG: 2-amino-4-hydroxy-6-hydroxymethyldihydropteridine diphosphokinase, partial [Sulfobacillus sp.]
MAKTYLALGSNLGNRAQYLRQAIRALSRDNLILATSPIYETAPMGGPPQADYLNQVIVLETAWTPFELLRRCQVIEHEAGRQRIIQDGPRTLDIDIVLYERQMFSSSTLTIPHPRLGSRRFVLEPLYRIDPALTLPTGQSIESLWRQVQDQSVRLWSNDGSAKDADFIAAASRLTDSLVAADSLDSTNSELRRLWAQGDAEDGMAVVAEQQTEGRGRLGR